MSENRKTYVGIVLDSSGSMYGIRRETVAALNRVIEDIGVLSRGQDVSVSLWTFSNSSQLRFFNADAAFLLPWPENKYSTSGSTALFDGVCDCIDAFDKLPDSGHADVALLVIVITDGHENSSRKDSLDRAPRLVIERQKTDRWTFAFQVPPGHRADFVDQYRIPDDNVFEWEATAEGVKAAQVANTAAVGSYFAARAKGQTRVASFYVDTDLSRVSHDDLKKRLVDIAAGFRVYDVPKEVRLDEFISSKTKKPYIVGSAYYQLMKKETIQTSKAVLIMEKGQRSIWGGREARQLIGLPDGAEAKVTPGNHAAYDIFVQSKSVNRKLPRGTRVLLDLGKQTADASTWDHQQAYAAAEAKRAQGTTV